MTPEFFELSKQLDKSKMDLYNLKMTKRVPRLIFTDCGHEFDLTEDELNQIIKSRTTAVRHLQFKIDLMLTNEKEKRDYVE